MAILMIDGLDLYNGIQVNIGMQSRWVLTNGSYNPGLTTGRFTGQSMIMNYEGAAMWRLFTPTPVGAFTVGHAFKCGNVGVLPVASVVRALTGVTGGGLFSNTQCGWKVNSDGSISVYRMTSTTAGTLLGTSAAGLILSNRWHWIDFSGTISTTIGTIIIKVDGVTVLNLTAKNTQGYATAATVDGVHIGSYGGTTNGQSCYWDDIYILDSATTLGERRIETIRPSADTVQKDFLRSSGTANFSLVNATLAQSINYVQSLTVGALDLYDLADLSTIPTVVDAVQLTAFANKTDASAKNAALVADLAGVQTQSADFVLLSGILKYDVIMATKPGGGSWSGADVNSLKIGPKVTL